MEKVKSSQDVVMMDTAIDGSDGKVESDRGDGGRKARCAKVCSCVQSVHNIHAILTRFCP